MQSLATTELLACTYTFFIQDGKENGTMRRSRGGVKDTVQLD